MRLVPIFSHDNGDYELFRNEIIHIARKNLRVPNDGEWYTSRGGLRSPVIDDSCPMEPDGLSVFADLNNWIEWKLNESARELFSRLSVRLKINRSWICMNRARSGDWNVPHDHGSDNYLSGVFYIDVPSDDCGNLYIMNPNVVSFFKSGNERSYSDLSEMVPREGRLIYFPSDLVHFVGPNLSNVDRIAYSFNSIPVDPLSGKKYSTGYSSEFTDSVYGMLRDIHKSTSSSGDD